MLVTAKQLDRAEFAIQAPAHTILCGQQIEDDGNDTGMTQPESMLVLLGSCAAFYAVQYLMARNLADTGIEVSVTADKLMQPSRLGNFKVRVVCPVSLTDDQDAGGLLDRLYQSLLV